MLDYPRVYLIINSILVVSPFLGGKMRILRWVDTQKNHNQPKAWTPKSGAIRDQVTEKINEEIAIDMGVSKNRDTPKWMVYNGKPY